MKRKRYAPSGKLGCGLAMALVLVVASAEGGVKHRYSFSSDASDSIGGANGAVVDTGTNPNHAFVGGQLDLSNNPNESSNALVEGAYVDLPNGVVTGAVDSGVSGAVAFEWWFTLSEQRTWQRIGDFGTSNDGEDTSSGGNASDYLLVTPNSGRHADGLEMTNHPASNAGEPNVGLTGPFPVNEPQHVMAIYDHTNTSAGANGTMSLYLNGAAVGSSDIHPDFDLSAMNDNNNWLGRSQWPDAVFAGSYDEFRIYDTPLGPGDVAKSYSAGADADRLVPEPTAGALALLGGCLAYVLRRRRR